MKKFIGVVFFIASFNVCCVADQIHHGRILSEKISIPKNVDGKFSSQEKNFSKHLRLADKQNSIRINTQLDHLDAKVNEVAELAAYVLVNITNQSDKTREYKIVNSLCAPQSISEHVCIMSDIRVELEPQGDFELMRFPSMNVQYSAPGNYPVWSTVYVWSEDDINFTSENNTETNITN